MYSCSNCWSCWLVFEWPGGRTPTPLPIRSFPWYPSHAQLSPRQATVLWTSPRQLSHRSSLDQRIRTSWEIQPLIWASRSSPPNAQVCHWSGKGSSLPHTHSTCRSAEVIRQYPNVMVMVNHCGIPYERDEANMKLWREGEVLWVGKGSPWV